MDFLPILIVIALAVGVFFVVKRRHPDIVERIEDKIEDVKTHVEGIVSPPGKQPEIVASIPIEPNKAPMETLKYIDVLPPKDAFLEDMNGRSYQLYIQTYQVFPKTKTEHPAIGVGITSDLSGIRVNDGSQITSPTPSVYPSGSIEANPTVKREKVILKEFLLSNPKTPEELKFNDLMANGSLQDAYKYAFRYYYRGEGYRPTSKGMGGSGGEFFQKIVAIYGDPGYKHLIAQFN